MRKDYIEQGDCLTLLKSLPDNSIDMIFTDLPYGTTACSWDEVIPLHEMWKELNRVIKPNRAMVFTATQPFTSKLIMSNVKNFKCEWIYKKRCASNFAQAKYAPMREHESVLVFGKGKVLYNPIKEQRKGSGKQRAKYGYSEKSRHQCGEFVGRIYGTYDSTNDAGNDELRYPSSVQEFNNRARGDRGHHPTQKPVALCAYFIKTYSNPGDVILDIAAGSGTTLVAAKKLARHYIGFELSEKYCKIAKERMNNETILLQ